MFGLGARWGIGHSTGLLLVGGIFVVKDALQNNESDDDGHPIEIPEAVTIFFESLVGIFMLGLGMYGIWEAKNLHNDYSSVIINNDAENTDNNTNDDSNHNVAPSGSAITLETGYTDDSFRDDGRIVNFEVEDGNSESDSEEFEDDSEDSRYSEETLDDHDHEHGHHHHHSKSPCLALCAGIFHGLAGPGGVLGVVPAIQLHNAGLAACYLLSFCASSMLTMGAFAALYGSFVACLAKCASSQAKTEFWIRCASASMSLLVGMLWLVLLAMGKLEDVFG